MKIHKAEFICSNTDYMKCPAETKPEYAFIGRSNVGKSSLINMMTNHKNLAKTSAKPGKTQLINHFLIDDNWYLVDLPGYGWAKASKSSRVNWEKMTKNYLINRDNLQCTFVLIDCRLDPQKNDIDFINWLGQQGIPIGLVFTKTDKITPNKVQKSVAKFKKRLLQDWESLPQYFLTSSVKKQGSEALIQYINTINENYLPNKINH